MIHDNMLFHNVEEMEVTPKGYRPRRLPQAIREKMNDGVAGSVHSTGMEIRFKMTDDEADIFLRTEVEAEAPTAHIFFGSFQGGWEYSSKNIGSEETKIHIKYPDGMELLKKMTKELDLPFSPDVVRIVLPYTPCYYVRVDGKVEPPKTEELPGKTYLAYGSSITHGSLGLIQPYSYPFRISQMLKCDYINLGHAGCALMEPEFARYIVSRKDWDFASVEMGINTIGSKRFLSDEEFERRIDEFTAILSEDGRPVFATSIFRFNGDEERQAIGARRRAIVRKYAESRLHFTDGLKLLDNQAFISADMTHPSLEGLEQISHRWADIMRATGRVRGI